jgi:uncharacterized protein (TIGR03067 family)
VRKGREIGATGFDFWGVRNAVGLEGGAAARVNGRSSLASLRHLSPGNIAASPSRETRAREHMVGCLVVLVTAVAAPVREDKDENAALDALRGEWVVVSSEEFGKPGELHDGDTLTFDGDRLAHASGDKPLKYYVRLAPREKPAQMDWRPADAAEGRSHRGIYKLDGDRLTVCVVSRFDADDLKDRPTEFRTQKEREKGGTAGEVLLVLERKKKK